MSQNVLGVLHTLVHLLIRAFQSSSQWVRCSFPFFVRVCDPLALRSEQNFRLVFEIHLYYFIAEPEHFGMASLDPLFDVD